MSGFNVPDPVKELERKVQETIEACAADFKSGKRSARQSLLTLKAIWDCSAGIISVDLMDIIKQLMSYMKHEALKEKQQ